MAIGHYVGVLSASERAAARRINEILKGAMRDGTLERIFRKWDVWNDDQPALHAEVLAGEPVPPVSGLQRRSDSSAGNRVGRGALDICPPAAGGGGDARPLVCWRWGWRSLLGVLIAIGRVYGGRILRGRSCSATSR